MTGYQVLSFGLSLVNKLLIRKCPSDMEGIIVLLIIDFIQGHGFRRSSQMIFQPPKDWMMHLWDSHDDLDLPIFWQPLYNLGSMILYLFSSGNIGMVGIRLDLKACTRHLRRQYMTFFLPLPVRLISPNSQQRTSYWISCSWYECSVNQGTG
jgi:hypothetical protein